MNGIPAEFHFGKSLREILGAVASSVEPAVKEVLTTGRPILNLEITGVLPTRAGEEALGRSPVPSEGRNWQGETGRRVVVEDAAGERDAAKGQFESRFDGFV